MSRIKLSKDFYLDEFTRSQLAARAGKKVIIEAGSPELDNLSLLVNKVIQPVRDLVGCPVNVLSGFRPPWLNLLAGGSDDSFHMLALAGDLVASGMSARDLAVRIEASDIPFDQLILEHNMWVHLSHAGPGKIPRRQVLTAFKKGNATMYREGL